MACFDDESTWWSINIPSFRNLLGIHLKNLNVSGKWNPRKHLLSVSIRAQSPVDAGSVNENDAEIRLKTCAISPFLIFAIYVCLLVTWFANQSNRSFELLADFLSTQPILSVCLQATTSFATFQITFQMCLCAKLHSSVSVKNVFAWALYNHCLWYGK